MELVCELLLVLLFFATLCLLPGILVARSLAQRPNDDTSAAGRVLVAGGVTLVTAGLLISTAVVLFPTG